MKIKYFDERLCMDKIEKGLTRGEYNARMGDLRMMELGGHVSSIQGSQEAIDKAAVAMGRKGGTVKSERKTAASRENGKKGGRPRKKEIKKSKTIKPPSSKS